MPRIASDNLKLDGRVWPLLRGGDGASTPVVFLHGGVAGLTPYCSSSHIWGEALTLFSGRPVIAIDLPGCGVVDLPSGQLPTIDVNGRHVFAVLDHLGFKNCHLVGHDDGGLLAIW